MLQKSRRLTALVLSILMCLTMLPCFALPAALAAEAEAENPYDAIAGTQIDDENNIWTPASNVIFAIPNVPKNVGEEFDYTYGDGATWGDGKTYRLTAGVNAVCDPSAPTALNQALRTAVSKVQSAWNSYNGYYADYTGLDTIVVGPGKYESSAFQYNASPLFNKPKDENGREIENPTFEQYFRYTVLGPQAGKSPVTSKEDPTIANGRSNSIETEAVYISTVWLPHNAELIVDGFAMNNGKFYSAAKGNPDATIDANADTSQNVTPANGTFSGLKLKNFYHHISKPSTSTSAQYVVDIGATADKTGLLNTSLEFDNYYKDLEEGAYYHTSDGFRGTRFVMNHCYENGTRASVADKYHQAGQLSVYLKDQNFVPENLYGDGTKFLVSVTDSTFNSSPGIHRFRFRFHTADYHFDTLGEEALKVIFDDNYFLDAGEKSPDPSKLLESGATSTNSQDFISFQDGCTVGPNGMLLRVTGNKFEYTEKFFGTKMTGVSSIFNIPDSIKDQYHYIFRNNIIKSTYFARVNINSDNCTLGLDASGWLWTNEKDQVVVAYHGSTSTTDSVAGDDFNGGIRELFTPLTGSGMAVAASDITAESTVADCSPQKLGYIPATVTVYPKDGAQAVPAEDLFTFQGEDLVEFVGLYDKGTKPDQIDTAAKIETIAPADLDGKVLVVEHHGVTSTCRVIFDITVADEDDITFVAANGESSYEFNGHTYVLTDDNRVATFADANQKNTPVIIVLPGTYTADATFDHSVAVLGPHFGVSPNQADDITKQNEAWAVKGTGDAATADSSKEAVIGGSSSTTFRLNNNNLRMAWDGVVFTQKACLYANNQLEKAGRLYFVQVDNCFLIKNTNHLVSGLGDKTIWMTMNARRYIHLNELRMERYPSGGFSLMSTAGIVADVNRLYVHGQGAGALIGFHGIAGRFLSTPQHRLGLFITNSYFDDAGLSSGTANWLYPNFIDRHTVDWGQTADASDPFFYPDGFTTLFDNNVFKNCETDAGISKGYLIRPTVDNPNDKFIFTNNTVTEDEAVSANFISFTHVSNNKTFGEWKVENNAFINLSNPISSGLTSKKYDIDQNYYAMIENGQEVVRPITYNNGLTMDDNVYYYDRACTIPSSDFDLDASAFLPEGEVAGFPDWTVKGAANCDVKTVTKEQLVSEHAKIVGVYSDPACETEFTGTESTFYVKLHIEGAVSDVVYTVNIQRNDAHSWGDWKVSADNPPTCTESGEEERFCDRCHKRETRVAQATGHFAGEPEYIDPTCTENGKLVTRCLVCDEIISETEVPNSALGHTPDGEWKITKEADCENAGERQQLCTVCGEPAITEPIEALGHDYQEHVQEATCLEDGLIQYICTRCEQEDMSRHEVIGALGHDYQEKIVREPTCEDSGLAKKICTRCEAEEPNTERIIDPTGHQWGNVIVTEPTCRSEGVKQRFCKVCEKLDDATREVIPADPDAHRCDEKAWVTVTAGDCLHAEVQQNTCDICGETVTRTVNGDKVTGKHSYQIVTTYPTFTAAGREMRVCTVCGESTLIRVLPRLTFYTDVSAGTWYTDYVAYVTARGLFEGYGDNTFHPQSAITRAEVITVVARLSGDKLKATTTRFADVPVKHWANKAVAWGYANKIVDGRSASEFVPDGNITREELCTILIRYANLKGVKLPETVARKKFSDDKSISGYAKNNVYICQQAGLIEGRGDGSFDPKANATRAEMSKIFALFIQAIEA